MGEPMEVSGSPGSSPKSFANRHDSHRRNRRFLALGFSNAHLFKHLAPLKYFANLPGHPSGCSICENSELAPRNPLKTKPPILRETAKTAISSQTSQDRPKFGGLRKFLLTP